MLQGETIATGAPSACYDCGEELEVRVLKSAAGYYIGTLCDEHGPHSRESYYYYKDEETAQMLLDNNGWMRR